MPDVPVEAIAEALREATPGPWSNAGYDDSAGDEGWWTLAGIGMDEHAVAVTAAKVMNHNDEADAHLIANAPTWLAQLLAALEASERENERLVDDMKTAVWQFNEAVSLLREARLYVPEATGCAEEVDESLPAIQAALKHSAAALTPSTPPDLREDA